MNISKNFTLEEMLRSTVATRCDFVEQFNPPLSVIENLTGLATNVLQPVRDLFRNPIRVTSGYRCGRLNGAVGGALTSQHLTGQAADLEAPTTGNAVLFRTIRDSAIKFDQLIWEYGDDKEPAWIHVSYSKNPRREVLRIKLVNGKPVTEKWR